VLRSAKSISNRAIVLTGIVYLGVGSLAVTHAQGNDWKNTIRRENIRPGEPDYPVVNPNSTSKLTFTGTLPPTLQIGFRIAYVATEGLTSVQSGKYCGFQLNSEAFPGFSVVEPLRIVRSGSALTASIGLDKYLPGRCGWHFNGIQYKVVNSTGDLTENWFAVVYDAQRDGVDKAKLPREKAVVWCKKNPNPADRERPELCSNFSTIQLVADLPPNLVSLLPQEERENRGVTWMFPDTRNVVINFFDLDSMKHSQESATR
jgi:hypothetical protein